MSFRRGGRRRVDRYDVRQVWKRLPHHLKTFDGWLYGGEGDGGEAAGLRDWSVAVGDWLRVEFGHDPNAPSAFQVGAVGGLTAAGWFEVMLSRRPDERRLMSVPSEFA